MLGLSRMMKGSRQDWGWGAKFLSENTRRRWKRIEDGDQEDQDDKGGESEGTEMRRRRRVSVAGDSLGRSSLAALLVLYTFFVGFG